MEPQWVADMRVSLSKLAIATDAVLKEIHAERTAEVPFRRGGVNWADLRCVSVEWVMDNHGDWRYVVNVEEAAPDEYELQNEVAQRLARNGYADVDVVTEW